MDTRTLVVRQAALDAVYKLDRADLEGNEPDLIRYLVEARGLERDDAMQALRRHASKPGQALFDAAIETMLTDPNPEGSMQACLYLSYLGDRRALPALRRAAVESPHADTRYYAICIGLCGGHGHHESPSSMLDPANVPTIRRALPDRDASVRVAAAWTLSSDYGDTSGLAVLVDGAHYKHIGEDQLRLGLAAIRDRRLIAALVRVFETVDGPHAGLVQAGASEALEEMTGWELGHGRTWSQWLAAHGSELPEQADPATVLATPPPVQPRDRAP